MVEKASVKTRENLSCVSVIFRTLYSITYVTRYGKCFGVFLGVASRIVYVSGIGIGKCTHWKNTDDCVYFKPLFYIIRRGFNNSGDYKCNIQ